MCGAFRPGHFNGVDKAVPSDRCRSRFFGEKDFQQFEIVACPTARETDGPAMSLRNFGLSAEQRLAAPMICSRWPSGCRRERRPNVLLAEATQAIPAAVYEQVEYLELRADEELSPLSAAPARCRVARRDPAHRQCAGVSFTPCSTNNMASKRPRPLKNLESRAKCLATSVCPTNDCRMFAVLRQGYGRRPCDTRCQDARRRRTRSAARSRQWTRCSP